VSFSTRTCPSWAPPGPGLLSTETQVRREYSWVPEKAFRKTRGAILASFLQRPRIYTTDHFANLLESQARSNLRYSLERLIG
jgi:predicted metal-dependent HD superfamily phosphohydrolase